MGYDITQIPPSYVVTLKFPSPRIMQSYGIDAATGEIYGCVADDTVHDLYVYRFSQAGVVKEWNVLRGGGHGNCIGVERDGQNIYIWIDWFQDNSGAGTARSPVRWLFKGQSYKTQIHKNDPTVQPVFDFYPGYIAQEFSINQAEDLVSMRLTVNTTETTGHYVQRKLSDMKQGKGSELYRIDIPNLYDTYKSAQSHCTMGQYLYACYGGLGYLPPTPGGREPASIVRFDWATGAPTVLDMDKIGTGMNVDGSNDGYQFEMEGMFAYYPNGSTEGMVTFGIATGGLYQHTGTIYAFDPSQQLAHNGIKALTHYVERDLPLTDKNNFATYDDAYDGSLKLLFDGRNVTISGELKLLTAGYIDGPTARIVANISDDDMLYLGPWPYPRDIPFTMTASNSDHFTFRVYHTGNLAIHRYGPTSSAVGAWLPIYCTYPVRG